MKTKKQIFTYLINLCFFLYFLILLIERSISLVATFVNGVNPFGTVFSSYVYSIVFASIAGFFMLLFWRCRPNIKALFKPNEDLGFSDLCLAGGVLLLSGMVHTSYTISPLQFASYGIWILGILFRVILTHPTSENKPLLWLSFAYLVAFSMAIPVMYPSAIELHVLFHILEAVGSAFLVAAFTYLLLFVFEGKSDLFLLWPVIAMIVFDVPLIALRWNEEINVFVLIFAILSSLLFLAGFIYKRVGKKKAD